jgi:hypothetical protein
MAPQYDVSGGRILTWALETHLADHCNLRCAHCCTLSPDTPAWFVDPGELRRDLERAATALRPHVFKLTGGEPLLHPELLRCLDAARASRISERISVTTNGLLLPAMPDGFFERIDRLTVSHYSSAALTEAALRSAAERCARHGVQLTVKSIDRFQRMDAETPHDDEGTASVFQACWLKVRCHMLYRGRFYACTRPPHLAARAGAEPGDGDGVDVSEPRLLPRLVAYLEREEPLAACRCCLGASGDWAEHRQLPARSLVSSRLPEEA